jgi:four helix bundle protein
MVISYRDLVVWNKAMELVTEIYRVTENFPKKEMFGLVSQVRRSAISIPSNIAEGKGRLSKKEFHYFLGNARGSLAELETQITIAGNLGYLSEIEANGLLAQLEEVGRLLNGLLIKVRNQ